jgi:tRNA-dihydrouridine synthase A
MDWTDRHCRAFHRVLTSRARLYSEMVTTGAVLHGDLDRLLGFDASEHPVALQLGGSDPADLAAAARIGAEFGYDEINLNVGCPSDRVRSGRFGACLMREPDLVADCVAAMIAAVDIPVTVKCRLGVDEQAPEQSLFAMADACAEAGARTLIVHARKAWLEGLSPKDNRDIPPLDYALVARLKRERPDLEVVINGGITSLAQAKGLLAEVDGVMLGRAAYHEPALLGAVDAEIFEDGGGLVDPVEAMRRYRPYVAAALDGGARLAGITRHMLGLFHGRPGARTWRRILTTQSPRPGAGLEVLDEALTAVAGPRAQPGFVEAA